MSEGAVLVLVLALAIGAGAAFLLFTKEQDRDGIIRQKEAAGRAEASS